MTEETQGAAPEAQPSETTLDQVYEQFNVDTEAQEFRPQPTAQPQQTVQPPAFTPPDPVLNQDAYRQWAMAQQQDTNSIKQSLAELRQLHGQQMALQMKAREEADIKAAVQAIKKSGFEADDEFIEVALGVKARQDPRLMTLYQNRHQKPQAWKAALGAVANEFKGKFAFKTDPQIAENLRAAKQSVQTSAATNKGPTGDDARFSNKSGKDFDAEWQRYLNSQ
jgi:hypothetical protein